MKNVLGLKYMYLSPWTKVSLDKSLLGLKSSLDKCLLGQMSPWTTVFLDYCPLDKLSLGPPSLGPIFQHREGYFSRKVSIWKNGRIL